LPLHAQHILFGKTFCVASSGAEAPESKKYRTEEASVKDLSFRGEALP
jgi:hypothetical protein